MADLSSETEHAPYGPLPRGGIVHPITRWGEDVMHRVQQPVTAYDDELRPLVRRHGRDDVRRRRGRAGRLPDRRRPGRLRLRLPRRRRPAHRRRGLQPRSSRCPRARTASSTRATRAACPIPGAFVECARPDFATVDRHRPGRLAGRRSAATACWPAASSTRPTTPRAPSSATGCRPGSARSSRRRWRRPPTSTRSTGPPSDGARPIPRVRIVHLSPEAFAALAARDLAGAIEHSGLALTPYFVSDERVGVWQRRPSRSSRRREDLPWVTGVIWWTTRPGRSWAGPGSTPRRTPTEWSRSGTASTRTYRRRGYARAALLLMIDRARSDPSASASSGSPCHPTTPPSLGLVAQLPFVEVGEQWDEEDGAGDDLRAPGHLTWRRAAT